MKVTALGWLLLSVGSCHGVKQLLLSNGAAKCVQLDVPTRRTIRIDYFTNDILMTTIEDENKVKEAEAAAKKDLEDAPDAALDRQFAERFNRKMEAMKNSGRKDMNILLFQQEMPAVNKAMNDKAGTGRHREQIDSNQGHILFHTGPVDTPVELCVQIYSAKRDKPALVAINATIQPLEVEPLVNPLELEKQQAMLQGHTSRISADLRGIQGRIHEIVNQADAAKKREKEMHDKIIALHSAAGRWPLLRIAIVIVAGYLQITRIIQYMKSRHII